jgi:hypothetical protein
MLNAIPHCKQCAMKKGHRQARANPFYIDHSLIIGKFRGLASSEIVAGWSAQTI